MSWALRPHRDGTAPDTLIPGSQPWNAGKQISLQPQGVLYLPFAKLLVHRVGLHLVIILCLLHVLRTRNDVSREMTLPGWDERRRRSARKYDPRVP